MSPPRHPNALNCWQVLGLPPDSDRTAIKKAYAARLKHTRPDDDAQAYQALRQAYEAALQWANTPAAPPITGMAEDTADTARPAASAAEQASEASGTPPLPTPHQLAQQLYAALHSTYDNVDPRAVWQHTAQALDALPLHWQHWASHEFAQLLLHSHARMPDWLQLALLQRFDWLNDFRTLQGLPLRQQQALHDLLLPLQQQTQREALVRSPAFQQANPELIDYVQLMHHASRWRQWLYALLAGSALHSQWQRALQEPDIPVLGLLHQRPLALAAEKTLKHTFMLRSALVLALWYLLLAVSKSESNDFIQWVLMLPAWLLGWMMLGGTSSYYAQRFTQWLHRLRAGLGAWLQARFKPLRRFPARPLALACLWTAAALAVLTQAWQEGFWPAPPIPADMRVQLLLTSFALTLLGMVLLPPVTTPAGHRPVLFILMLALWLLCFATVAPWISDWLPSTILSSLLTATAWWLSCASLSATAAHTWLQTRQPRFWQEALRWALRLGPAWPWTLLQLGWRRTTWPPLLIIGTTLAVALYSGLFHALLPLCWLMATLWLAVQYAGRHLAHKLLARRTSTAQE
ncbi:MAG: J domain-containing protein [Pseudomonadota bacterium]|nr:J domain-containing protein [Pseudomonadota bacterium]